MPHRTGRLGLLLMLLLVAAGMVVVLVWGDDLRPAVHAFLQNAARRL